MELVNDDSHKSDGDFRWGENSDANTDRESRHSITEPGAVATALNYPSEYDTNRLVPRSLR